MPGNLLFNDASFPQVGENESWQGAAKKILNYQYLLKEQLAYTLNNLDAANFNPAGWDKLTQPIYAQISAQVSGSAATLRTELSVEAGEILAQVSSDIADSAATLRGELSVRAEEILAQVSSDIADSATTLRGEISVQAGEILAQVAADYASGSSLAALSATVGAQGSRIGLLVTTSGGSDVINAASIVAAVNSSASSVAITADHLNLSGYITASDLAGTGTTLINGAEIRSGLIQGVQLISTDSSANSVYLANGELQFKRGGDGAPLAVGPYLKYNWQYKRLTISGNNPDDEIMLRDHSGDNCIFVSGEAQSQLRQIKIYSAGSIFLEVYSGSSDEAKWEFKADGLYKDGVKLV